MRAYVSNSMEWLRRYGFSVTLTIPITVFGVAELKTINGLMSNT